MDEAGLPGARDAGDDAEDTPGDVDVDVVAGVGGGAPDRDGAGGGADGVLEPGAAGVGERSGSVGLVVVTA